MLYLMPGRIFDSLRYRRKTGQLFFNTVTAYLPVQASERSSLDRGTSKVVSNQSAGRN